jgi:hypothetical protein
MLDHLEVAGYIFQHFAFVLAKDAHRTAAVRADRRRRVHHRLARQMLGQPATRRLALAFRRCRVAGWFGCCLVGSSRLAGLSGGSRGRCPFARLDLLDGQLQLEVFQPLVSVLTALKAGASFVLTPHACEPLEEHEEPNDISIMRAGIYNLGFLGVTRGEESLRILHWWSRRLRFECVSAQEPGIFVDQKFVDLVPTFARNCHISHDTTLNVAYWRCLETADNGWLVDGQKLTFFHFSGFDPRKPSKLSKYTSRLDGDLPAPLQQITTQYAKQILENGHETFSGIGYAYRTFRSGTPIHPYVRRMFRERHQAWPGDPFWNYEAFLHQYAPGTASEGGVTNFMKFIHEITPNLNRQLDLQNPDHCKSLIHWYLRRAERDILLDERLIAPVLARIEQRRVGSPRGVKPCAVSRADATVVGYLRTASGVGEAGRQTLRALASTGMVVNGYDVDLNVIASRSDESCAAFFVTEGDGKAQIFCINADQLPQVMRHVETHLHDAAVRVCIPFWELSEKVDSSILSSSASISDRLRGQSANVPAAGDARGKHAPRCQRKATCEGPTWVDFQRRSCAGLAKPSGQLGPQACANPPS